MKSVRLSKYISPIRYDLELAPDLENFTFHGREIITIKILEKTKTITLHSKELEIETARLGDTFGKVSYNTKNETATFTFPKFIPQTKGKSKQNLRLEFKGILNDKMRGFYRSKYSIKDKELHMATTQFEATDARRAFPSFDEPAHKAVFHVSLIVPKGKTAISNTLPVSIQEHQAGYQIIKFAPTPKMSTYLLAFLIGDFEFIESKTKNDVLVRIYATPGKLHQARFALTCAVKTLEFFENYFAIPYPLNTLDMVAIPDFQSGAMENWGAITYRESALLVDEEHSSLQNKQWVALVIAHEIAHQWFGNLVTMEWWTHLWLNEGFASYIEYLAVDKLFPKWDIWTQFSVNDLGVALRLDSLKNTHPIEVEVHHPDEIGEIFDEVSYSKGASIIRMLASYLGERDFRDGLRYYLKKHSYKNTETLHLWQAFEKISKKPVAKMMHTWTSKPGYPVVKAKVVNGKVNFSQERFFLSPISRSIYHASHNKTKWQFLVNFKHNKVNYGEAGFFRTAYSPDLLEKLREPISQKTLSARDRLGVIRDLFALSEAGIIPTTEALEFLEVYNQEDNYTVWVEIASGLSRLEQAFSLSAISPLLNKLILKLFSPLAKKLGWNKRKNESHTDALLRPLALARSGRAGEEKIIREAREIFNKIKKKQKVNPDIRGSVYSIIATHSQSQEKDYRELLVMYKKETLHEEKNRIGVALGDFTSPRILSQVCQFAISKSVRPQDSVSILSSVGSNPLGRNAWLSFVKKNWKTLVSRYGDGGHILARLVKAISGSAEEKHFRGFKKFFNSHPTPGAERAVEQVLERLKGNIAWRKRDEKSIIKFLLK